MKKAVIFSAMAVLAGAGASAFAQESGRVISSTPVVQQVAVPSKACAPQVVQRQNSGGGAALGAVIGGVLGNALGHGTGRALATGAGIFGGAVVGDRLENGSPGQTVQNCATQTSYQNRTVAYNVVYEYGGHQYTTQLPYDPGQTIRLQVSPAGANAAPVSSNMPANGVVTAPPMVSSADPAVQYDAAPYPVQTLAGAPVVYAAPAYPVVYAPGYYGGYYGSYYPPVGLSLAFGYGGWGGGHYHHHWH